MDVLSAVKAMKVEGLSRIADPTILNILNEVDDSSIDLIKLSLIAGFRDLLLYTKERLMHPNYTALLYTSCCFLYAAWLIHPNDT